MQIVHSFSVAATLSLAIFVSLFHLSCYYQRGYHFSNLWQFRDTFTCNEMMVLLQLFVAVWYKGSRRNDYVCDVGMGFSNEINVFCDVT